MGYGGSREEAGQATKKTADGGIDGIINEDRLGLDSIYIQAKRWKDTVVSRPEIQKFSGALDTPGATKGIFITTSTFTKEAKEYAKNINNKKIVLIDGSQLAKFMIDFNVGVSLETRPEIQKFSGALDTPGATKGIFITTSTFTKEAKEYAKNINNKKIVLIEGSQLAKLMIDFNVGVSLETVYEIKKIDSDYFIED